MSDWEMQQCAANNREANRWAKLSHKLIDVAKEIEADETLDKAMKKSVLGRLKSIDQSIDEHFKDLVTEWQ